MWSESKKIRKRVLTQTKVWETELAILDWTLLFAGDINVPSLPISPMFPEGDRTFDLLSSNFLLLTKFIICWDE